MSDINQKVTVRKQKIRKNHVRAKLIFFTILVQVLLPAAYKCLFLGTFYLCVAFRVA